MAYQPATKPLSMYIDRYIDMSTVDFKVISDAVIAELKTLDSSEKGHAEKMREAYNVLCVELDTLKGDVFADLKLACETLGLTHLTPQSVRKGFYATSAINAIVSEEIKVKVKGSVFAGTVKVDTAPSIQSTVNKMDSETFYKSSVGEVQSYFAKSVSNILKALHDGVKEKCTAKLVYKEDEDGKKLEFPDHLLVEFTKPLGKTVSKQEAADSLADKVIKNLGDLTESKLIELQAAIEREFPEAAAQGQDVVLKEREEKLADK